MLLVERVVALDAELVDRVDLGSVGDEEVVLNVAGRFPGAAPLFGFSASAGCENAANAFTDSGSNRLCGNLVAGERRARHGSRRLILSPAWWDRRSASACWRSSPTC